MHWPFKILLTWKNWNQCKMLTICWKSYFYDPYKIAAELWTHVDYTYHHCSLLQAAIGAFSTVFPDYQERFARHEAAHFLGTWFPCPSKDCICSRNLLNGKLSWKFSRLFDWPPYPWVFFGHWKGACQFDWWAATEANIQWAAWWEGTRQVTFFWTMHTCNLCSYIFSFY